MTLATLLSGGPRRRKPPYPAIQRRSRHPQVPSYVSGWLALLYEVRSSPDLPFGECLPATTKVKPRRSTLRYRVADPLFLNVELHLRQRSHDREHH